VHAIAIYVASLQSRRPATPAAPAAVRAEARPETPGALIFAGACAQCHANGALLTTSTALAAPDPRNAAQIVLGGTPWEEGTRQAFMPPFAASLTDRQVAQVLSYVRARYGGRAPWPSLETAVSDARRQGGGQ
jgi:mono/diheme cytochrome c family protein